ncbi:hypothetical protein [Verrucomicrobium spinosum]|uniref:hypothetical protein n=1 Tax=Verrucomicrobium spinosum TaxID=2736 RepID=UPI00210B0EFC|nr:hypothetical protein [Verrucomicrobium spinosum]
MVDVFLERGLVEEAMLQPLAEELGWPWEPMLQPKLEEASELKRLCPARLALRHRLLPLGVEETAASALASGEGTAEPAAPGRVLLLACYDPLISWPVRRWPAPCRCQCAGALLPGGRCCVPSSLLRRGGGHF